MKKISIYVVLFLLSLTVNSQIEKKLNYEQIGTGNYLITSVSNKAKGSGKGGPVSFIDENIINNQLLGIINEILPREKQDLLQLNSLYFVTFNSKGEVINCKFIINKNDMSVLTEKDFVNLYNLFMQIKVDMSNVRMEPFDYTEISCSFASKERRELRNKEIEKKRRLKKL